MKCHKNKRSAILQLSIGGYTAATVRHPTRNPLAGLHDPQFQEQVGNSGPECTKPGCDRRQHYTACRRRRPRAKSGQESCYSFGMSQEEGKAEDELMRALQLELAQKRLRWQHDREKYRTLRILSFSFLSLVILAGMIGFFFFFTRANDAREQQPPPSPTLSPH